MTDGNGLRRPITIAHRFGNGLDEIVEAEAAGADIIELDVWMRRGRLEVRHEHTLGAIPIWYDKWKVERAREPLLLGDVLGALRPSTGLMLDLKGTERAMPAALIEAIRPHVGHRPLMVSARVWKWLPSLRVYPELMLFHSVGKPDQLRAVRPLLDERENDAISIQYTLLDADVVRSLKQQVSILATWPINDDHRLGNALDWGVDAIISDDLAILRHVARER